MEINYTVDDSNALTDLVHFIEEKNTKGAGLRWLSKYETYLQDALQYHQVILMCNNATFKSLNLKCIYYNDWLIAFSVQKTFILIEAFIHKSRIKD